LPQRSTSDTQSSSRRSRFLKSLSSQSALTPLELQEVRELKVSSRDSEFLVFKDALIEVSARLPVSELGIHLQSNGLLLVLVNSVTTPELSLTRRFTALVLVPSLRMLPTMLCARPMPLRRILHHSVDSLIMAKSTRTSFSSRVASWVLERDHLSSENRSSLQPNRGRPRKSTLSSSIPHPKWAMVASRPQRRRTRSSDLLLAKERRQRQLEAGDYNLF